MMIFYEGNKEQFQKLTLVSATEERTRLFRTTFLVLSSCLWGKRSGEFLCDRHPIFNKFVPPDLSFVNISFRCCLFGFKASQYLFSLCKDSSNLFALLLIQKMLHFKLRMILKLQQTNRSECIHLLSSFPTHDKQITKRKDQNCSL